MRIRLLLTLLVSLVSLAAQTPEDAAMQRIRPEAIRAHMAFLADDLLEGRGTGTRGHELAARYVAAQLEAMGLQPGGLNHGWLQSVPLRRSEIQPAKCTVSLIRNGREESLEFARDYAARPDALYEHSTIRAPLVFVGFGVSAPALNYDDYAGIDVRGKIVVLLTGAPPSFPSAERAHYSGVAKFEQAAAHGAVGIITIWAGDRAAHSPFPFVVDNVTRPGYRWLDSQGRPNDSFPQLRASIVVSEATARRLFEGAPKTFDQALADTTAGKMPSFPLPYECAIHLESLHTSIASPNVMGLLPGSDPVLRDQYLVYSAHLDHLGIGRPVDGDAIYNGALDNASGSAALIELARAFTTLPRPPRRSILFVWVTGEEAGLIGSDYFAHNPTVARQQLAANLNMDGVDLLYDFKDVVALGGEHSSLGGIVRQAAARMDLLVSPDPMPEEVLFIRSDQYSFVRQGIPAVAVGGGFQARDPGIDGKKLTLEWEAKFYHSPKDDMAQPFDFNAAIRCTRLNFLIGYLAAQSEERPAWNAGDFFSTTFASGAHPK